MRTPRRAYLVRFLLFLLHPEDSTNPASLRGREPHLAQFDNRVGGALKIAFWLVVVIVFWTTVPTLCGHFQGHSAPSHRECRTPLALLITPAADTSFVLFLQNGIFIYSNSTGTHYLQTSPATHFPHNRALAPLPFATAVPLRAFFPTNSCREKI